MRIARIIYPVNVLGRGVRACVWTVGCNHRCKGCSNPELWDSSHAQDVDAKIIFDVIKGFKDQGVLDGVTITGGEPFLQPEQLSVFVKMASGLTKDIMVYSGYTLKELRNMENEHVNSVLSEIAVLIDGKYIEERNFSLPLRGSNNQQIHILNEDYKKIYEEYLRNLSDTSEIENYLSQKSIISVGIHKPGFNAELESDITSEDMED